MNNQINTISLFSDDVMIYLSNPTNSFTRLVQVLDIFSEYSGCKINIEKTHIFMFNRLPDQELNIK